MRPIWALSLYLLMSGPVAAMDLTLNGMADFRLVAPSGQQSNMDGGFGKFSWGNGRGSPVIPDLGQLDLRGAALLTPDLLAVAEIRYDPRQKTAVELLESFVRYRPVSTSRWRWAVRAGAFFPPVSLENTALGWMPEWTITPSAINAWVGEELRVIGAEASMDWRGDVDVFTVTAAAYAWNEPAGAAIAAYGWTFNDHPLGLFGHLPMPVALVPSGVPAYEYEFRQFDHSVGWYLGASWDRPDLGRVALLRYDNEADPNAHDGTEFAWRTKFWSLGFSGDVGPVLILAQAMVGTTTIEPAVDFTLATEFWAWYVLAGYERGEWRYALRFDQFGVSQTRPGPGPTGSEHGVAGTAAVTWTPRKGISVAGEVVAADYTRADRVVIGKTPHVTEIQTQLALRLSF